MNDKNYSPISRSSLRRTRVCFRGTAAERPDAANAASTSCLELTPNVANRHYNDRGSGPTGSRSLLNEGDAYDIAIFGQAVPLAWVVVLASVGSLVAHDMWIEPTTFSPDAGEIVGVRLRVGQDLLGDPLPRDPALIEQFVVVDAAAPARRPRRRRSRGLRACGRAGSAGHRLPSNPASRACGGEVQSVPQRRRTRHDRGVESAPKRDEREAREMFSRCAKSLVLSGPATKRGRSALGFPLELVAERNPYALPADQDLPVRLTYENRPLAGALVVAMNRSNPSAKVSARTDNEGRVRLRLPKEGCG